MNRNKVLSQGEQDKLVDIGCNAVTCADIIAWMMMNHRILIEPQYRPNYNLNKNYWRFRITDYRSDLHDGWIKEKWSDVVYADEAEAILAAVDKIIEVNWMDKNQ